MLQDIRSKKFIKNLKFPDYRPFDRSSIGKAGMDRGNDWMTKYPT